VFDRTIGKKYLEMIGEPVPASWSAPIPDRASPPSLGWGGGARRGPTPADQGRGSPWSSRRAAGAAHNNERQAPAGYGVFFDPSAVRPFAMSTQLPDVQPDALAKACEAAWQFERYKASLLPRVDITEATAKVLYTTNQATRAVATQEGDAVTIKKSGTSGRYRVIQVTATIENSGTLPTQVANGPTLRGNREDAIWLIGANGRITFLEGSRWLRLGVLQGTLPLPQGAQRAAAAGGRGAGTGGRGGRGAAPGRLALSEMRQQRADTPEIQQTGNRRVVSWLVAVEGDAPLKLAVSSQKGGTAVKDLVVQ
jgi:hypothetical protein